MRRSGEIPPRTLYLWRITPVSTCHREQYSRTIPRHPAAIAASTLHPYGISASGPDLCLCLRLPPKNMSQTKSQAKSTRALQHRFQGIGQKNRRQNRLERKERSDRCFTDLLDQLTKHNIAHSLNKLDAPDNKVTASAHPSTRDLVSEFTHHPRNVHHNTT